MRVVVLGGRDRREKEDFKLVNQLLDELKKEYSQLLIITAGCDRGVGKIINNRLMPKDKGGQPEINYVEYSMRPTVHRDLPKHEMSCLFIARNATLVELGDEFHLFVEQRQMGIIEDLRQRCLIAGKPHAVYRPGIDTPVKVNWPQKGTMEEK